MKSKLFYNAILLTLSLCYASTYIFISIADRGLTPIQVIVGRSFFGLLSFVFIIVTTRISFERERLFRVKSQVALLVMSLLYGYFWFALAFGEHKIPASVTSLLSTSVPIFTFLISVIILRTQKITGLSSFGAILAAFGIAVMLGLNNLMQDNINVSYLLFLLSGFLAFAVASLIYQAYLSDINPVISISVFLFYIFILFGGYSFCVGQQLTNYVSLRSMFALLGCGIVGTSVPFLLLFYLNKQKGAVFASSFGYLVPIFGLLLGIIFLGDGYHNHQAVGIMMTLSGIALLQR